MTLKIARRSKKRALVIRDGWKLIRPYGSQRVSHKIKAGTDDTLSVPEARRHPPVIYDTLSYYTMRYIYIYICIYIHDCTILHCTILEYSIYYSILYHIILYYIVLYRTVLHYTILYNIALYRAMR